MQLERSDTRKQHKVRSIYYAVSNPPTSQENFYSRGCLHKRVLYLNIFLIPVYVHWILIVDVHTLLAAVNCLVRYPGLTIMIMNTRRKQYYIRVHMQCLLVCFNKQQSDPASALSVSLG